VPKVTQKLITTHLALLGGGAFLGWLYGNVTVGLLVAALVGLGWQLRQLVRFESALRSKHFGSLKYGDSVWSQLYSRFSYQRQRIKYYRKRYRQLLKEVRKSTNAMPDGSVILSPDFEIVRCNRAAEALAGFRRKGDRGQRVDNILRDPAFGAYLRAGEFSAGLEIASPMQQDGWLLCRIVPYGADQSLLILQDITERRRLSAMRREFVGNASHELRSPLTVVTGYLDSMAEDESLPDHWKKPLDQMSNQANRMNNIVAELLELSRLESSGAAPTDEIVDVCGLFAAARKSAQGRQNVATIEVDCESKVRLLGSTSEIESVIVNLLSNALRYTPGDGTIMLRWLAGDDGAELTVTDTGIGIEEEFLPRLTERFFRVDRGRSRDEGGVGLGLAIVKHILERHEARMEIESRIGEGSRFTCHFPAARLALEPPIPIARGGE
jgi:two-component system phosphate regulon sensor histidine kinase PhoR